MILTQKGQLLCSLATLVLLACSCVKTGATQAASSDLAIKTSFHGLWWSAEQIRDPNPAPKNTDVALTKWEYDDATDPHPDIVDVVVEITNPSTAPASDLTLQVSGAWNMGRGSRKASAKWGTASVLQTSPLFSLAPQETKVIRVPVNFKKKMDTVFPQGEWLFAFRASIAIKRAGAAAGSATATLPIVAGD